jgi:hypothetical protein
VSETDQPPFRRLRGRRLNRVDGQFSPHRLLLLLPHRYPKLVLARSSAQQFNAICQYLQGFVKSRHAHPHIRKRDMRQGESGSDGEQSRTAKMYRRRYPSAAGTWARPGRGESARGVREIFLYFTLFSFRSLKTSL